MAAPHLAYNRTNRDLNNLLSPEGYGFDFKYVSFKYIIRITLMNTSRAVAFRLMAKEPINKSTLKP